MQRNYFRGMIICLLPTLVAAYFAFFGEKKKGIDLAGGTILVFEVDKEKTDARLSTEGRMSGFGQSEEDIKKLAENIKRRIDPVDTRGVIVRPVGSTRIEILLPISEKADVKKKNTEDFVYYVKNIVSQAGVLDYRILANMTDDEAGIRSAEETIDRTPPERLDELAKAGKVPPSPDGEFAVRAASDVDVNVRYVWVELGKTERDSMHLSNKFAGTSELYAELAAKRNKLVRHSIPLGGENAGRSNSIILFSRECKNEKLKPEEREEKKFEYYMLTRVSPKDKLTVGGDITLTASPEQEPTTGNRQVAFRFNSAGGSLFGEITERNRKTATAIRNLAVVLDNMIVSAPTLNAVIRDSGVIQGNFTESEVNTLVNILRSGALNAELKPQPVSENTVGPTLGADTISKGLWAVGLSFAAVMIFMIIYYRFVGVVACIALLINLLLTIGFMVSVHAAFTLAGLAGIVLMLGMAVDANVLIYERMREEREKGATLAAAVRNGYDRSLPTILDTHVTSILTAIVLFAFGNDNLKGFSVSLVVGLVISLFTALFVTRLIIDYAMTHRIFKNYTPMKLFSRPNFNPMKYRFQFFTITTVLTVVGLALFLMRGDKVLNVDFTRGTSYTARLVNPLPLNSLLNLVSEDRQKEKLKIKNVFDPLKGQSNPDGQVKSDNGTTYTIEYEDGSSVTVKLSNRPAGDNADEAAQLAALKTRASSLPDVSIETMQLSGLDSDLGTGLARSFTLRTTEQEQRLVEVMLDRLLRDEKTNEPLLILNRMKSYDINGTKATLSFEQPISPQKVTGQLDRQFEAGFLKSETGEMFELSPIKAAEGSPERVKEESSEKYTQLVVDVSKNPIFTDLRLAADAKVISPLTGGVCVGVSESNKNVVRLQSEFGKAIKLAQTAFASTPIPDSVQTFDPALAADTRNKAFYAILGSWAIILIYLWFRFGNWTFGLAAVLCLIHDLCFTLGLIAVCHYLHAIPGFASVLGIQDFKIDLAAVAALLTLVGYSVNDTIVVFDRIREVRGKNPALTPQLINDSVNQTLSRTVLASLTVFLVVGVLYFFGGNGIHLFAFVMVVGVLVGTYSSIFVAAPLLLMFGEGKVEHKPLTPSQAQAAQAAAAIEKQTAL